jgi:putative nucleotidyltransferase with HDIG domain
MNLEKLKSNIKAFFRAWLDKGLTDEDVQFIREYLSKQEQILFYRMALIDQKHALYTAYTLRDMIGKRTKIKVEKLYKAALLHDVGKVCTKMTLKDRVFQSVMFTLFRPLANYLAEHGFSEHTGRIRRLMYCYKYHPVVGADLAREIGVEENIVYLIEHHEDRPDPNEPRELAILREADNLN